MNIFQKQLLLDGTPLPFHRDLDGQVRNYGPLQQQNRVSAEEFERDMRIARAQSPTPAPQEEQA